MVVSPRRWKGPLLEGLRKEYEAEDVSLTDIARAYQTSLGCITRLALKNGWKPRRPISTLRHRTQSILDRKMARAKFVNTMLVKYETEMGILVETMERLREKGS